jgi:hypothetical protein
VPPSATPGWGADGCYYDVFAGVRIPGHWCLVPVAANTWDVYAQDPSRPGTTTGPAVYRADALDPEVDRFVNYATGATSGVRRSDGAPMVWTEFGWVTEDAYRAALAVASQSASTPAPAAVPVSPDGDTVSQVEINAAIFAAKDHAFRCALDPAKC